MDHHFIYLTPRADEHQEQLQSYYKLTEEDLEEITKEWSVDLLVPADPADISDIDSPEAAQDTPGPSKIKKTMKTKETKKPEEVQDVDSYSAKTTSFTPDQEGNNEDLEEVEQQPGDEVKVPKKRKGSPSKSSSKKKAKATMTKMKTTLNPDDFSFLLATLNEAIEEITEKKEAKQQTMYDRIEVELQGVQRALQSNRAVSTAPMPEGTPEAGDESVQLRRIVDLVEVHLRKVEEVTVQATQALKHTHEEIIEQRQAAQQEKEAIQEKFDKERTKIQKEKEKLLAKQIGIEEAVNRAFHSVTSLEQKAEEPLDRQVMKLAEVIQQLQQRVIDLELQIIPSTPQEERDQREITARGTVERIKELTEECKQLSTRSAQIHESLTENPELHKLESQLQEAKQQADRLQMQLKALPTIEKMKRSHEQRVAQQQIHMIQSKVMEVTQQLQPLQDKACQLFLEIENQGTELQQVVITAEQHLEGPVNNALIQEFVEQEEIAKQQVEAGSSQTRGT
jgi:hypothetical protein